MRSTLADTEWIGEKTPMTICEVRVSPKNSVKPNIGAGELAEALNRVLPFTAKDDNCPVLQCVNFVVKEGKLTLVSADGFRLAVVSLDYDEGLGMTYEIVEETPQRVVIRNLRCPFFEVARMLGMDAKAIETGCCNFLMKMADSVVKQINPGLNVRVRKFRSTPDGFCDEEIALS